jgi:pimeloyl-ACP methyl ester carboxylesterase
MKVHGRNVEVRRVDGRDPVLVFLHEGLGSVRQWRSFPDELARATGRGAFLYSRLGYGASDPVSLPRPLTYMQDEARDFLPGVLDEAGLEGVILVGHSDGASIALVHAALDVAAPDRAGDRPRARVRGLVLEAPHVFVEDLSVASITEARDAYEHGDLRDRLARYHDHVDVAFWGWNRAWLDPAFRAWNLEEYLPRIAVPVLVIQGEDDPYGTRAQVDAIVRQVAGPVEVVMLPRCGHAPHRDRPDETRDAIAAFVQRIA